MPVVWHETVGKKCNVPPRDRRLEKAFEVGVIAMTVKQDGFFCPAVQDMEHNTGCRIARSSRHDANSAGNLGADMPD
jgi:hypothetical protein